MNNLDYKLHDLAYISCIEHIQGHMMKKHTWLYVDPATSFIRRPLKTYLLSKIKKTKELKSMLTISLQSLSNFDVETNFPITEKDFLAFFGLITVLCPTTEIKKQFLDILNVNMNIAGINDKKNYLILEQNVIPYFPPVL